MKSFRKTNHSSFNDSLLKEVNGLNWLKRFLPSELIGIPKIHSSSEKSITMDDIEATALSEARAIELGRGLAALHQQPQSYYGFEEDNYIGLNPQCNTRCEHWGEFFVAYRLRYQIERIDNQQLRKHFSKILEKHAGRLVEFLDQYCQHPSLVHGDLWSGNVLYDSKQVWLIDPAVYFGDREVDLAMTEMFGGFPPAFYLAYDQAYPRTVVYDLKKVIYNLYHYLNHYNLFGESYLQGCEKGLATFESL